CHTREVRVHRHPPGLHGGLYVRFAHQEIDGVGAMAALRHDDVEDGLDGVPVARGGDLADPLSLHIAERVLESSGDQDTASAAGAESMRASTRGIRPQLARPASFKCEISAGMSASRAMRNSSSSASSMRMPSFRMCDA